MCRPGCPPCRMRDWRMPAAIILACVQPHTNPTFQGGSHPRWPSHPHALSPPLYPPPSAMSSALKGGVSMGMTGCRPYRIRDWLISSSYHNCLSTAYTNPTFQEGAHPRMAFAPSCPQPSALSSSVCYALRLKRRS